MKEEWTKMSNFEKLLVKAFLASALGAALLAGLTAWYIHTLLVMVTS